MTFQETWLPFIYLYGVGGLAFFLGLILIIKTKALRLDYFKHKTTIAHTHKLNRYDFIMDHAHPGSEEDERASRRARRAPVARVVVAAKVVRRRGAEIANQPRDAEHAVVVQPQQVARTAAAPQV